MKASWFEFDSSREVVLILSRARLMIRYPYRLVDSLNK
jgi:hypothetical protein